MLYKLKSRPINLFSYSEVYFRVQVTLLAIFGRKIYDIFTVSVCVIDIVQGIKYVISYILQALKWRNFS